MNELLQPAVLIGILTGAIRFATPYLYASIGEMFAQRSGVVNLGVDGIMLVGAFAGFFVYSLVTFAPQRILSVFRWKYTFQQAFLYFLDYLIPVNVSGIVVAFRWEAERGGGSGWEARWSPSTR